MHEYSLLLDVSHVLYLKYMYNVLYTHLSWGFIIEPPLSLLLSHLQLRTPAVSQMRREQSVLAPQMIQNSGFNGCEGH